LGRDSFWLVFGQSHADAVKYSQPVGIMFHHALMGSDERNAVALMALLEAQNRAHCQLMQSLAGKDEPDLVRSSRL
jgi:hypothetical protein